MQKLNFKDGLLYVSVLLKHGVIDPYDRIDGLLGLDFLKSAKAVIDLDSLAIFEKKS